MTIAAVAQMLSGEDVDANLQQAADLVAKAAQQGAKLVVLPENLALLDSKALITLAQEEQRQPKVLPFLTGLAKTYKLWLIAGSVPLLTAQGDKVFASSLVISDQGIVEAQYNKIHLFDVDVADAHSQYRESDFIEHGDRLVLVDTPIGRLGLSICYDVRFPEQYQRLRAMGAEVITVPSAFTYATGEAHWEILLRARAIETQCYILAPNQGGTHTATRKSWGHSMIVEPWGNIVAECEDLGPGLALAELDLKALHKRRQAMPIVQHRERAGF